jgi:uncharacterized phiE125 gp8 family phage protein
VAQGDLTSLANVRSFMRIPTAQTDGDTLLTTFVSQASKAIMRYTGREFQPDSTASQTRIFAYRGGGMLFLTPYDLRAATLVQIDTETDSPTTLVADEDYFLHPRQSPYNVYEAIELRGFTMPAQSENVKPWREVEITGTWGFATVPDDVIAAANMLVAFWYRQHSAVPGRDMAGEGDRFGPVNMPSAVMQLLAPYRVMSFGFGG